MATMISRRMKKTASGISPVISVNKTSETPLHRQVYEVYRRAIVDGSLRTGQRVPSTRTLAAELGISRIPVLNAYAQLLAEGYFESRVGAGTVVSRSLPDQIASTQTPHRRPTKLRQNPRPVSSRCPLLISMQNVPWQRGWGAFGVSQVAFEHFPFRIWNSLLVRHSRNAHPKSLDYGDPMGLRELREAIAAYLRTARGVRCETEQIMIVSGSQQAIDICTRVLLDTGSRVWMEEPGYRMARSTFTFHGCEVVPVPVDYEGLNVDAGVQRSPKARAALVTPSHQYPLGVTMTASRRMQLLDWAERAGAWVIEDDYDSEYRYDSMPIPSLQGLDSNSRVVYVGTFSKVLFPALRLGYIVIPADLVANFTGVRVMMDIGPPIFYQRVLADFIREGHFSRHLRRMRLVYRERRTELIRCLRERFGYGVDVVGGQAGMHLSVTFKDVKEGKVVDRAASQKLWLTPLSSCYSGTPSRRGFILGFGSTPTEEMTLAVRKLHSAMRDR